MIKEVDGVILKYGNLYVEDVVAFHKSGSVTNVMLTNNREDAFEIPLEYDRFVRVVRRLMETGVGYVKEPVKIKREVVKEERMV